MKAEKWNTDFKTTEQNNDWFSYVIAAKRKQLNWFISLYVYGGLGLNCMYKPFFIKEIWRKSKAFFHPLTGYVKPNKIPQICNITTTKNEKKKKYFQLFQQKNIHNRKTKQEIVSSLTQPAMNRHKIQHYRNDWHSACWTEFNLIFFFMRWLKTREENTR